MYQTAVLTFPTRPRTDQEIAREIQELDSLIDHISPATAFGNSNVDAMEAATLTVENGWPPAEINEELDEDEEYVQACALDAAEWLSGEHPEPPSVGFRRLLGEEPRCTWIN